MSESRAETHTDDSAGIVRRELHAPIQRLKDVGRYNLETFRQQPLKEISGSLGDLGTLLPIMIALAGQSSQDGKPAISLSSTLVFAGIANIATGFAFGLPLPVQPMKAIASVALAQNFNREEVASAGLFVALVLGLLSITGLLEWFTRRIPIPVIKGIQSGAGFTLIMYAGTLLKVPTSYLQDSVDWIIVAIIAFLLLLWNPLYPDLPYALAVVVIGVLWAILDIGEYSYDDLPFRLGLWKPHALVPSPSNFRRGALEAGLGQIPLTTLNSVIAVCFLSKDLLPNVRAPSITAVGLSVTVINLVGCWFGMMPVCHGSGGLAAQYRFGARSGASVIFLGLLKLILGLFAAPFAQIVFNCFPKNLLGIMVIAAGLELVGVGESLNTAGALDLRQESRYDDIAGTIAEQQSIKAMRELSEDERKRRWTIMAITIGGVLAFHNDAVGFLAGMVCHWSFQLQDQWTARREGREGRIRLSEERAQSEA